MDPLHSQPSQEYPIRALVRHDALHYPMNGLCRGDVISVRNDNKCPGYCAWGSSDLQDLYFRADELIIDPTPEQIAEERAKAGLPAEPSEGKKDLEPVREDAHRSPSGSAYPVRALDALEAEIAKLNAAQPLTDQQDWRHRQGVISGLHKAHSIISMLPNAPAEGEALPEAPEGFPSLPSAPSVTMGGGDDMIDLLRACASYVFANEDTREWSDMTDGKRLHGRIVKAIAALSKLESR